MKRWSFGEGDSEYYSLDGLNLVVWAELAVGDEVEVRRVIYKVISPIVFWNEGVTSCQLERVGAEVGVEPPTSKWKWIKNLIVSI